MNASAVGVHTEEKQNLRGIINHSGLSSPSSFAYPSTPRNFLYTPCSAPAGMTEGRGGLLYTYLPRARTDTTYFVSGFACEKAASRTRFPPLLHSPGFNGPRIYAARAVFWMRIYRAHASRSFYYIARPPLPVTRQILIHRNVISSFYFYSPLVQ